MNIYIPTYAYTSDKDIDRVSYRCVFSSRILAHVVGQPTLSHLSAHALTADAIVRPAGAANLLLKVGGAARLERHTALHRICVHVARDILTNGRLCGEGVDMVQTLWKQLFARQDRLTHRLYLFCDRLTNDTHIMVGVSRYKILGEHLIADTHLLYLSLCTHCFAMAYIPSHSVLTTFPTFCEFTSGRNYSVC